ncbi:hypothetical protein KQ767_16810, partial [Listeria monocytogenes]|nr:hypothetical protein [Listeria monocytogenes]
GVPVDSLSGEQRFRHLVRFSQKGSFNLPPARYLRLYAPEQQALEAKPARAKVKVEGLRCAPGWSCCAPCRCCFAQRRRRSS